MFQKLQGMLYFTCVISLCSPYESGPECSFELVGCFFCCLVLVCVGFCFGLVFL